jgi:hypothetical protein
LLDSFSYFPLGWIIGTIIPLAIDNFSWIIRNKYKRILEKPMTCEDKYKYLYENVILVKGALFTSGAFFILAIVLMFFIYSYWYTRAYFVSNIQFSI